VRYAALDRHLVESAQSIRILTTLAWPERIYEDFMKGWEAGDPRLPVVSYPRGLHEKQIIALHKLMKRCDRSHPIGNYIYLTAASYATAAKMLDSVGTPAFTELSGVLYGRPTDAINPGGLTHLDAADHFIEMTGEFMAASSVPPTLYRLSAEEIASALFEQLEPFFHRHKIRIEVDPSLASRATAGAQRIRIREGTPFSMMDRAQLVNHEGFVHMLTSLNGRNQPNLPSMGLGAPRTTGTQEGLATFAELITSAIDLNRLRRIALRSRAVQMGLEGADFLQVFRYFLEAGQNERESFQSTARIFRGGDPRGRVVFTKDIVYVQGLISVHTFLRKAVQLNKFHYAEHLLAGRFTLGDIIALESFVESGFIVPPLYEPPWLKNRSCLAAYLCYSIFANKIHLGMVTLEDFSRLAGY
jgi:uncharacterized protein (TIGR02421 family)